MFRAAWQFHLFQDPAGAYCNIVVGRAEAVALDKDLVCSGQSGSFRQTIYFNADGRSHQTRILYVQGGVTVPSLDIFVTQTAYAVVVTLLSCRLSILFYFYPLVWYLEWRRSSSPLDLPDKHFFFTFVNSFPCFYT